jgi:hypothetical protein
MGAAIARPSEAVRGPRDRWCRARGSGPGGSPVGTPRRRSGRAWRWATGPVSTPYDAIVYGFLDAIRPLLILAGIASMVSILGIGA